MRVCPRCQVEIPEGHVRCIGCVWQPPSTARRLLTAPFVIPGLAAAFATVFLVIYWTGVAAEKEDGDPRDAFFESVARGRFVEAMLAPILVFALLPVGGYTFASQGWRLVLSVCLGFAIAYLPPAGAWWIRAWRFRN